MVSRPPANVPYGLVIDIGSDRVIAALAAASTSSSQSIESLIMLHANIFVCLNCTYLIIISSVAAALLKKI